MECLDFKACGSWKVLVVLVIVKVNSGLEGGVKWVWAVLLGIFGVFLLLSCFLVCCLDSSEAVFGFCCGVRFVKAVVERWFRFYRLREFSRCRFFMFRRARIAYSFVVSF